MQPHEPGPADMRDDAAARPVGGGRVGGLSSGYYLYGVVRAGDRSAEGKLGLDRASGFRRIQFRDLEALTRQARFDLPALGPSQLVGHQRVLEWVMRAGTVIPAPPGIIFRGRRPLVRFLEDQYLALDRGLSFLEDHWELRLHVDAIVPGDPAPELHDRVARIYAELRSQARAAIPFPRQRRRLLSAAFLVERSAWIPFVERAEDLIMASPELQLDITGPWPPYDFIRMTI